MRAFFCLPLLLALAGCNWIGNVSGLNKEANKAIGAACRQTGRSLEECFRRNPDADMAQIYAGWREMHEYMQKNRLDTMTPPPEETSAPAAAEGAHPPAASEPEKHSSAAAVLPKAGGPLTNEEAERQAEHDPQVEAILSTIRKSDDGKKKQQAASGGEADQKRLLKIIDEMNNGKGSAAAPAPHEPSLGAPAKPAPRH